MVAWVTLGLMLQQMMQYVGSCEGGRRIEEAETIREHTYSNGSLTTLFVVVVVIAVLGVLAGLLARLCNGRHRAGNLDYDFEGWVEKKCASCIDGSITTLDLPPPAPTSAHLFHTYISPQPLPIPSSTSLEPQPQPLPQPPPSTNGVIIQSAGPSLVQIPISDGAGGALPPTASDVVVAGPMGTAPINNPTTTGTTSSKKKKKRKSGGGGGGGGGAGGGGGGMPPS